MSVARDLRVDHLKAKESSLAAFCEETREATALVTQLIVLKSYGARPRVGLDARLRFADASSSYRRHRGLVATMIRRQARQLGERGVSRWDVVDEIHARVRFALAPEDQSSEPALEILSDITLWVFESLDEARPL